MDAGGLGVAPELLTEAADSIDAVLRGGSLGNPPRPAGGADYGHPAVAAAVGRLGDAVQVATQGLLAGIERDSTGLRAAANAYLAQEAATSRSVTQPQAGLMGLAGLMGISSEQCAG